MTTGSLTAVGTGIRLSQLTAEARSHIESAEKLLYLVTDPVSRAWLTQANATAESLGVYYSPNKLRMETYLEMVERTLACVREGRRVCVALYGHPGIFAFPAHEAIRRARQEGYRARMLPGVSAEDCLFADLGIDPGAGGCQSFEATDFLISGRRFDPRAHLILWQVGVTGEFGFKEEYGRSGLHVLVEVLAETYGPTFEVVLYEAASYVGCDPKIEIVALADLPAAAVTPVSTLYLPPRLPSVPDRAMVDRLGLTWAALAAGTEPPGGPR